MSWFEWWTSDLHVYVDSHMLNFRWHHCYLCCNTNEFIGLCCHFLSFIIVSKCTLYQIFLSKFENGNIPLKHFARNVETMFFHSLYYDKYIYNGFCDYLSVYKCTKQKLDQNFVSEHRLLTIHGKRANCSIMFISINLFERLLFLLLLK